MKNKERQKLFKERRKAKGFIRKEIWIKPAWWVKVRELLAELDNNRRNHD